MSTGDDTSQHKLLRHARGRAESPSVRRERAVKIAPRELKQRDLFPSQAVVMETFEVGKADLLVCATCQSCPVNHEV